MSFVGFHSNTDGRVCRFSLKYTYIPFVGDCEKSLFVKRVNPYPFSGHCSQPQHSVRCKMRETSIDKIFAQLSLVARQKSP